MTGPLVTIGVPTYNRANSLPRALDSLLSQTYNNLELIISDNASTDNTGEVVMRYARKDPRVRYIRKKENIGAMPNFLSLLPEAGGVYFMWASDDDLWDSKFVETLVAGLEKYKKTHDIAMSSYERVYPDARVHEHMIFEGDMDLTRQSYYSVFKKYLVGPDAMDMYVYGIFRKSFLDKLSRRGLPECKRQVRTWMSEMALATHFYSAKELLCWKEHDPRPTGVRHGSHGWGKTEQAPLSSFFQVLTTFTWLITSPNIPFMRKPLIIIPWLKLAWGFKRKILKEFFGIVRINDVS